MEDAREVGLRTGNDYFGVIHVEEVYSFDKLSVIKAIYQTDDLEHPGVKKMVRMKDRLIGGKIDVIKRISQSPLRKHRMNPFETMIRDTEERMENCSRIPNKKCSTHCSRNAAKSCP